MSRRNIATFACFLVILVAAASPAIAEIWGVKTDGPFSNPPSTLFRLEEDGSSFTTVGVVTLDGVEVDVDGLAVDRFGVVFGFVADGALARLVTIDPVTAEATEIGVLSGRDMRGATFAASGELVCIDTLARALVWVDSGTALQIGTAVPLRIDGQPFTPGTATDLAIRNDGLVVLCQDALTIYSVDLLTGVVSPILTDGSFGPDGYHPVGAGVAFPSDLADERLILFDINGDDDVFTYLLEAPFTRTLIYADVIPGYTAGRGDLASYALDPLTNVDDRAVAPALPHLLQNVPNPFNPATVIAFSLTETTPVTLAVYGLDGGRIVTLLDGVAQSGRHEILWDGLDAHGRPAPSGIYVYRLEADGAMQEKRMTLVR